MRASPTCIAAALMSTLTPAPALAATYYAAPSGNGSGTSEDSPASVSTAVNAAQPGDTVYLRGGTYTGWSASIHPVRSGTASAWITFAAYPGELPIFEGSGVGGGTHEYIRFVGLVSRGGSGGFGNGWTDGNCSTLSNSNLEYINCIAEGNDINGIAHYCASGVHIKQCIVAHNGNADPSWSSGVNLFAVRGGPDSNIVEQTISFENIDISSNHSDGSGFIVDQGSQGATFINNIGFRNGGSCIRLTNSTNTRIINNTCVTNGQDPTAKYHDEIFFSDTSTTHQGALLRNNLCIPTSGQSGLTMGNGVPAENNIFDGAPSLVVSASGALDYHLQSSASAALDQGSTTGAPGEDIGFDWRCIKQQSGQAVSWWQYAIDYDYIASIGGVAACFNPGARQGVPDIGAYEFGATTGSGGSSGTGGAPGGGAETGGVGPTGGSGVIVTGGGAGVATGGVPATGGISATGAGSGTGGAPPATCTGGLALCGPACVSLASDPQHCGACGAVCGADQVCSAGFCTNACGSGLTLCGRGCSDPNADLLNCGACATVCLSGQTCQLGQCLGQPTGGDPTVPLAPDTASPEPEPDGCGCAAAGSGPRHLWGGGVLLVLGLAALSRRRQRSSGGRCSGPGPAGASPRRRHGAGAAFAERRASRRARSAR